MDWVKKIEELKKQKNAIIMAHYYQDASIQDIADYVGDSLALAQWAAKTTADIIVMCGVHFMGETAKILSPDKKVLVPDTAAGCSLADSCPADEFAAFIKDHPNHTVISYVNTTAAVKALTDVVVTSTNAKSIVDTFKQDEPIIFGPDYNLGNYINGVTGRNMVLWKGACHVHEKFAADKLKALKQQYPDAPVLTHPECKQAVVELSDFVGSTQAILNFAGKSTAKRFIVVTESGILHKMRQQYPDKEFIAAPSVDGAACNECNYMRLNTLEKVYNCLLNETPEVIVEKELAEKAVKPILKMLELSC
ncbi:MAG: quinolinate synthase NadA [Paludibacteraceae bacterium]|nr:quinolinate synthase NadA [Paludibacteraceae bacterium]